MHKITPSKASVELIKTALMSSTESDMNMYIDETHGGLTEAIMSRVKYGLVYLEDGKMQLELFSTEGDANNRVIKLLGMNENVPHNIIKVTT